MTDLALASPSALLARIEAFLNDPSFSADTRRTYRTALEKFAAWLRGKTFATPREAVVEFVRHLQAAAPYPGREPHGATASLPSPIAHRPSPSAVLRPNTIQLYKAAVMSFLGYHGVVVGRVKSARRSRHHLKDAFTPEEVRRMIDAWTGEGSAAVRNRALIALLATTGLRQVEAWRADEADLRVRDGIRTLVIQGKGEADKNNFVVIGPEAWAYLRDWLKIRERILTARATSLKSPPLPSPSSTEISNLKSEMASSPAPSPPPSEISNFKSEMASSPSPALFLTTGRRTLAQRMTR
ncbi:MAG: tyrosine-type recombinase/integrase, partial [Nitrospirae bacterium]|nr:tyrosine-type recombinase/integrase [Nitrospirota bacterium]